MPLFLIETVPSSPDHAGVQTLLSALSDTGLPGAEVVESQVPADHSRVFTIVEADDAAAVTGLGEAVGAAATEVQGPDEVRLVGAELDDIKALKSDAQYLVEWDIPAEITMETYLARKKANAPKYAEVPETSFLRTYVREDTAKCLCFYDAPDQDAVVRARDAVSTPIDRIWSLDLLGQGTK